MTVKKIDAEQQQILEQIRAARKLGEQLAGKKQSLTEVLVNLQDLFTLATDIKLGADSYIKVPESSSASTQFVPGQNRAKRTSEIEAKAASLLNNYLSMSKSSEYTLKVEQAIKQIQGFAPDLLSLLDRAEQYVISGKKVSDDSLSMFTEAATALKREVGQIVTDGNTERDKRLDELIKTNQTLTTNMNSIVTSVAGILTDMKELSSQVTTQGNAYSHEATQIGEKIASSLGTINTSLAAVSQIVKSYRSNEQIQLETQIRDLEKTSKNRNTTHNDFFIDLLETPLDAFVFAAYTQAGKLEAQNDITASEVFKRMTEHLIKKNMINKLVQVPAPLYFVNGTFASHITPELIHGKDLELTYTVLFTNLDDRMTFDLTANPLYAKIVASKQAPTPMSEVGNHAPSGTSEADYLPSKIALSLMQRPKTIINDSLEEKKLEQLKSRHWGSSMVAGYFNEEREDMHKSGFDPRQIKSVTIIERIHHPAGAAYLVSFSNQLATFDKNTLTLGKNLRID